MNDSLANDALHKRSASRRLCFWLLTTALCLSLWLPTARVLAEEVSLTASCSNSNGSDGNPWSCDTFTNATIDGSRVSKVEIMSANFDDSGRVVIISPSGQTSSISTIEDKSCLQNLSYIDISSYFTQSGTYTIRLEADNDCRTYVSGSVNLRVTYEDDPCKLPDAPACDTPGICQTGPGTCRAVDGIATCTYPVSKGTCDADGDECTLDVCTSTDGGQTAACAPGQNVCSGIIPCGRAVNNPETPNDDTETCSLCHLAMLLNNFILFLFGIVSATALLAFVVAGFMYVTSGANPVNRNAARGYVINIVKGYAIVFTAWLIIDFVLSAWGFIDPLGGEWSIVCILLGL